MLNNLVDHAKLRISTTATRLGGQLVVGVLFLIAAGFGVAAIYVALAQSLGAVWACVIMAAAFVVLALIVAVLVVLQQRHQEAAMKRTSQQSALMSGIMSATPMAIMSGVKLSRAVGKRAPLFMLGALVGGLLLARSAMTTHPDEDVDRT
jgi:membrane protein YdbS with pleckstrin-like domain